MDFSIFKAKIISVIQALVQENSKGTYLDWRSLPLMLCDAAYTLCELPQTNPDQQEKGDE